MGTYMNTYIKNIISKIVSLVIAVAIMATALVGCGGDVEQTNDSLTLYSYTPDEMLFYNMALEKFKTNYPNVKVNIEDYTSMDGLQASDHLSTAVMAGNGPDVIMLSGNMYNLHNVQKMMQNEVFADLKPFIDADVSYNKSDYYEPVIKAGEYKDKQYIMPLSFSIPMVLSTERIMNDNNVDYTNFKTYTDFAKEIDSYLLRTKNDLDAPRVFGQLNTFLFFMNYTGIEIADYDKQQIDLLSPELKQVTDYYKNLYPQEVTPDGKEIGYNVFSDLYKPVIDGTSLFAFFRSMNTHTNIMYGMSELYLKGEEPILQPLKDIDGKISAEVLYSMAIKNTSNNKQNAYNLIKIFLEDDFQALMEAPVKKNALKKSEIEQRKNADSMVFDTSKEYFDEYYSFYEQIEYAYLPTAASGLYWEYMQPYFKNEMTYEECLNDAQKKFDIHISE